MAQVASLGILAKSANPNLPVNIAQLTSLFLINNVNGSASAVSEVHQQNAIASVESLQAAVLKSAVTGQKPQNLVAGDVRMTVSKQLPHDMLNATLSPPQTDAEKQYGAPGPRFQLPAGPFTCPGSSMRAASQMGMMQWGSNPFGTSAVASNSSLVSPLSRFSNTVPPPRKSKKNIKRKPGNPQTQVIVQNLTEPYYIVIQFAKAVSPAQLLSPSFAKPSCGVMRGSSFVACPCNE